MDSGNTFCGSVWSGLPVAGLSSCSVAGPLIFPDGPSRPAWKLFEGSVPWAAPSDGFRRLAFLKECVRSFFLWSFSLCSRLSLEWSEGRGGGWEWKQHLAALLNRGHWPFTLGLRLWLASHEPLTFQTGGLVCFLKKVITVHIHCGSYGFPYV